MYKVYRYTFPDGKIYIGVTKNTIQYRKDCGYQHNQPLTNAIRSVGFKNVIVDILTETDDKNEAYEKEIYFIDKYKATDPTIGYNISYGGKDTFQGLKHTDAHKKKMSLLYTGKTFSKETIEKMLEAHKKEWKPVDSITENGTVINHYKNLADAAKDVGGYKSNISRACKNPGKPYKGLYWRFATIEGGDDR